MVHSIMIASKIDGTHPDPRHVYAQTRNPTDSWKTASPSCASFLHPCETETDDPETPQVRGDHALAEGAPSYPRVSLPVREPRRLA